MKTATVRDLRNNFARLSVWIDAGQEIQITKRGEVIGTFVPAKKSARKHKRFDLEAHRKWMRETYGGKKLAGNSVLIMREGSKW
jgi:antitoxin (DNA-binding transcriptional repressor) of toxin-antitoxin stability system